MSTKTMSIKTMSIKQKHDTDLLAFPKEDWTDGWGGGRAFAETVLWTVAIACLLVVGWSYLDTHLYQPRAAVALEEAQLLPPGGDSSTAIGPVAHGAPVGKLEIPRLDLSVIVAEGTDETVLRRAVGRLASSAIPGDGGNLALAGHRDTFFRPLEDVQAGDEIVFEAVGGRRTTYVVKWTRIVDPTETWVAAPTLDSVLTLVTCYPFRFVGTAPQRFIVRAQRVEAPVQPKNATGAP